MQAELVEAFVAGWRGPDGASASELDRTLRALVSEVRGAWPCIAGAPPEFARYVAQRLDPDRDPIEQLEQLEVDAIALTYACSREEPAALRAFERLHGPDIDVALRRMRLSADAADECRQAVLTKLFAPGRQKIGQYAGKGALGHWVRAVTAREAISLQRRQPRGDRTLTSAVSEIAARDDPELGFLEQHYRDLFKHALGQAFADLQPTDRLLLTYRYVDGLTLPQVAAACGVHRATAARGLARLRKELLAAVRRQLQARLQISRGEFESLVRLIRSHLDVSLSSLLPAPPGRAAANEKS